MTKPNAGRQFLVETIGSRAGCGKGRENRFGGQCAPGYPSLFSGRKADKGGALAEPGTSFLPTRTPRPRTFSFVRLREGRDGGNQVPTSGSWRGMSNGPQARACPSAHVAAADA